MEKTPNYKNKWRRPAAAAAVALLLGSSILIHSRNGNSETFTYSPGNSTEANGNLIKSGEWSYMPGAQITPDGLQVNYADFKIAKLNNTGYQENPPVNLYGTHLKVPHDFYLTAEFSGFKNNSSLWLYGQVPVIQDEFRVNGRSLQISMQNNQLNVQLWDGRPVKNISDQKPAVKYNFPINNETVSELKVSNQNDLLAFSVNGRSIGKLAGIGIFNNGDVWIGADAQSPQSSFLITNLQTGSLSAGTSVKSVNTANVAFENNPGGLQNLATKKHPGMLIGTAAALGPLSSDSQYLQTLSDNFGSITTENALKWQFSEPRQGQFDIHEAEALVYFAKKNNIAVHGHTLIFSEALPLWVQQLPTRTPADKAQVEKIMTTHINYIVSHLQYIKSWDVVDEPITDFNKFNAKKNIYRDNVFYRAMGASYINIALTAAHNANPGAKLYINDFGNENYDGDRWQATYKILKNLKQSGAPLDGFGFESHIYDPESDAIADKNGNTQVLTKHITDLGRIGLSSRISEIDVDDSRGEDWQASQYASVLNTCVALWPTCASYTTWGISDRYDMYQSGNGKLEYGHDLLFDDEMNAKQAYSALQLALKGK
jgi:endo-1,4-beta-xylanase